MLNSALLNERRDQGGMLEQIMQFLCFHDLNKAADILCRLAMTDEEGIGGVNNKDIFKTNAPG